MHDIEHVDRSSRALARRALVLTAAFEMAGSGLGSVGILQGSVIGLEIPLIVTCLLLTSGFLTALLLGRDVAEQTVALLSTLFFAFYLCAGSIIAVTGQGEHLNLYIYLVWFFPLIVFNKLVNAPGVARFTAKGLLFAPILTLACVSIRLFAVFRAHMCLCWWLFA